MKSALRLVLLALASGCWESGTEAPPLPAIVSPLEDAGGRFRPDAEPADLVVTRPLPTLAAYAEVPLSGASQTIDLVDALGREPTPGATLVMVVVNREAPRPRSIMLGARAFNVDTTLDSRPSFAASVWSTTIAERSPSNVVVNWPRELQRGYLVAMEWLGLDRLHRAVSRRSQTEGEGPIRTGDYASTKPGTLLLAIAVAAPLIGSGATTFTQIVRVNDSVAGLAVASTIADGLTRYEETFVTWPGTTSWGTMLLAYDALSR
ncbi:MAG: hypothetical protein KIT84_41680 [Labilithrix sp.]|nr:hypothetical protein [Labilithrix sp.]MCW5817584.1 hypothetical protein [Labilithrix sp.]